MVKKVGQKGAKKAPKTTTPGQTPKSSRKAAKTQQNSTEMQQKRSKRHQKTQQKASNSSKRQQKHSKIAQKTAEKAANNMENQQKAQDSPEAGTKTIEKTIFSTLSPLCRAPGVGAWRSRSER